MDAPFFLFGTLCHAPLLQALVAAQTVPSQPGEAPGWRAVLVEGGLHPVAGLVAADDAKAGATGLLAHTAEPQRVAILTWAAALGMAPMPVTVMLPDGGRQGALALQPAQARRNAPGWSLALWAQAHGALALDALPELLALAKALPPQALARRLPTLALRVASRLRAQAEPALATLRRRPGANDVQTEAFARPYAAFFAVEESDLRFRRFDGGLSPPVRRAGFVMADAVTVLPYDPERDLVLVVEQFRYGPLVRGDPNPWSLEAVAGRLDANETPEQALHRETLEETGLNLCALHPVGRYYPSPGAVSEYIWSYIGVTALDDRSGGIGGLQSEAEDIRAHVISRQRLMGLIESGEVENGPLILSAFWLSANLARLRRD